VIVPNHIDFSDLEAKCIQLLKEIHSLRAILELEGEKNWVQGIDAIATLLQDSSGDVKDRLYKAKSIYTTMMRARNGFSDFHIWRDKYEDRVKANEDLKNIRNRLWNIFESL
jgi:hypothetical protein